MRAVAISPERRLELVELEPLALRDRDVRVEVAFCGICGSDLHYLDLPELGPAGTVMGHELSGVVVECGAQVEGLAVGERITALPFEHCGECRSCRRNLPHLCTQRLATRLGGRHRRGAFAETVVVPAASAFRIPTHLSAEHAALTEPLAVGMHAVAVADLPAGAAVVVLGGGPIGVMTALALVAEGFERIVTIEINDRRRRGLERLGLTALAPSDAPGLADLLGGDAPSAVFDCTGHPSGLDLGLGLLEPRGVLVLVGYSVDPVPVDSFLIVREELQIRGAATYAPADFTRAIEQLAGGSIPAQAVITSVQDLARAQECFDDLASGASDQLKVLLTP